MTTSANTLQQHTATSSSLEVFQFNNNVLISTGQHLILAYSLASALCCSTTERQSYRWMVLMRFTEQFITRLIHASPRQIISITYSPGPWAIRHYLDSSTACTIATSIVHSNLDYCNSLYYKLPKSQLSRLHRMIGDPELSFVMLHLVPGINSIYLFVNLIQVPVPLFPTHLFLHHHFFLF